MKALQRHRDHEGNADTLWEMKGAEEALWDHEGTF